MPRRLKSELLIGIGIGIFFGLFFYFLISQMPYLGRNIPSPDVVKDYAKGFTWCVILFFVTLLLPASQNERTSILVLWGIRSIVTLGFMLYYEYSYGLDAYNYFTNSLDNTIDEYISFDSMNGTYMVMKTARFFVRYLPYTDSYHALKVIWSFFGFLGSFIFYKAYSKFTDDHNVHLLWILQVFPSALFWSSILGKDPITYLGISIAFYGFLDLLRSFRIRSVLVAVSGLLIMGAIRTWLIPLFVTPFVIIYFFRSPVSLHYKVLSSFVILLIAGYYADGILESINVANGAEFVQSISHVSQAWNRGGSGQTTAAFGSGLDVMLFIPKGTFAALFRPLPGEINNVFGILSGLENLFLLVAFIGVFYTKRKKVFTDIFVQYCLVTIFIWGMFYSFISFQNLGTAVRFKLQVLSIMLLLIARARQLAKIEDQTAAIHDDRTDPISKSVSP